MNGGSTPGERYNDGESDTGRKACGPGWFLHFGSSCSRVVKFTVGGGG